MKQTALDSMELALRIAAAVAVLVLAARFDAGQDRHRLLAQGPRPGIVFEW